LINKLDQTNTAFNPMILSVQSLQSAVERYNKSSFSANSFPKFAWPRSVCWTSWIP